MAPKSLAPRYFSASLWTTPLEWGKGTSKTVSIKTLDGRITITGVTEYIKPSGPAGVGVKGKYVLKWTIVDRWIPSSGRDYTEVPVMGHIGKMWTYDKKTALSVAEKWMKERPLETPMPESQAFRG